MRSASKLPFLVQNFYQELNNFQQFLTFETFKKCSWTEQENSFNGKRNTETEYVFFHTENGNGNGTAEIFDGKRKRKRKPKNVRKTENGRRKRNFRPSLVTTPQIVLKFFLTEFHNKWIEIEKIEHFHRFRRKLPCESDFFPVPKRFEHFFAGILNFSNFL